MVYIPSPAVSIVGRHNSGKTTMIVKLIEELARRGRDVGSIKHHSHDNFEVDYPGKDSYRHREAGATETVIASPSKLARVKTLHQELECSQIVNSMPGHDVILVEGYRKSGLPTIELMRAANPADAHVAEVFLNAARAGLSLESDFSQIARGLRIEGAAGAADVYDAHDVRDGQTAAAAEAAAEAAAAAQAAKLSAAQAAAQASAAQSALDKDIEQKMPGVNTVAVITDIPQAAEAAKIYGIPYFDIADVEGIVTFLEKHYVRQRVSVVIQAGGESKRMGRSKATVPFDGRPLICRLIERLAPAADELIITTNEADKLNFLDSVDCALPEGGITLVPDLHDQRGALPGLHTAFAAAKYPFVAIVACDMIFASPTLVVAEAIEMAETDADVVVPVNKHGYEPFHAMYRRESCLAATERALAKGALRAQALFDDPEINVCEFSQAKVLRAEPRGGCFINANTPDELARIEESYIGE